MVTGSSQGIGRAYALELASRGLNVALVARSKERLEAVAAEVRGHGVEARVVVVDFTHTAAAETAVSELARAGVADIGVLVNNVGMMGPHFLPFLELEAAAARDMVTVNCVAATVLTHSLLPAMLARGRGAVVNIVSSTSFYVIIYFCNLYVRFTDIKLCPGDALLRGVRGHEALHVCLHCGAAGGAGAGLGRGDPGGGPRPGGHQHGQEPHPHLQGEGHIRRECCCLNVIPSDGGSPARVVGGRQPPLPGLD